MNRETIERLKRIQKAYDTTVKRYNDNIDPLVDVPVKFKQSQEFRAYTLYQEGADNSSGAPDIREYLAPEPGMRFLDAGCCANLANYHLYDWPSTYYGVDISSLLIQAMERFVTQNNITIGGLWNSDIAQLSFEDHYFDICAVIGVFEYSTTSHMKFALRELHRVLNPSSKVVMDIPNPEHPHVETMFRLEQYLGRPNILKSRVTCQKMIETLFCIHRIDDSQVMIKYFLQRKQGESL
ncbi:MAG: class I SAM-dependent methyltransferase [candidate division WOR-3 bacterium]|nr:MAG: class I SAM-dependent methyltransferase [candidate division WOR-3 bacterium]